MKLVRTIQQVQTWRSAGLYLLVVAGCSSSPGHLVRDAAGDGFATEDAGSTDQSAPAEGHVNADTGPPVYELPCSTNGGDAPAPAFHPWFGLCGSSFGPWRTELVGSATGGGLAPLAIAERFTLVVDPAGRPIVIWPEPLKRTLLAKRLEQDRWQPLGQRVDGALTASGEEALRPVAAVDPLARVTAAWWDSASGQIFVKRLNGTRWEALGTSASGSGISGGAGPARDPALALDSTHQPVAAWAQNVSSRWEVHVSRWNDSRWEGYGGSTRVSGLGSTSYADPGPLLRLDPQDRPVLLWRNEASSSGSHRVVRWDGARWTSLAELREYAGLEATLALEPDGTPWLAFLVPGVSGAAVALRRWDGQSWSQSRSQSRSLPSSSDLIVPTGASEPTLLVGSPESATVGFRAGNQIHVYRYDQAGWRPLLSAAEAARGQGVSATSGASSSPMLSGDASGLLVVSWVEELATWWGSTLARQAYARRWSGQEWVELEGNFPEGGLSNTRTDSQSPAIIVDDQGRPTVAWVEAETNERQHLYVLTWTGSRWAELGGSAHGEGISPAVGTARMPAIALDPAGRPIVAWRQCYGDFSCRHDDGSSGAVGIFVRRWTGKRWEELDGSGTGSGLSEENQEARWPAITVDREGDPIIAWEQHVGTEPESQAGLRSIYLRRWNSGRWEELGGSASGSGLSRARFSMRPTIAVDADDRPIVAWTEWTDGTTYPPFTPSSLAVYLRRWNGSTWEELAGSSSAAGVFPGTPLASQPALVIDGDVLLVAAQKLEQSLDPIWEIGVRRWDGTAWSDVGARVTSGLRVAYREDYFGKYFGQLWGPHIAVDKTRRALVGWGYDGISAASAFVAREQESGWTGVGALSEGGLGVSNARGKSVTPAMASGGGRVCTAWSEPRRVWQIALRCADLAAWDTGR